MENNHFSNIIAPSDGVRRFLCKTSVLFVGLATVFFSVFSFRMNQFEHTLLGGSLRSTMLFGAYIMMPLGLLTAAIFARIKKMGMAYAMISLLIATAGAFMLFLNAFASLLRETRLQGVAGSLLEWLTFAAMTAICVNLVMSCMEFKIQPVLGIIGTAVALLALAVTTMRIANSFSAMQFVWNEGYDWTTMAEQVKADKLQYHYKWIFRSVAMNNAKALQRMFYLRLCERIASCVLYTFVAFFCVKYKSEMKAFNKLIEHAGEYVDIPKARIAYSLNRSSEESGVPIRKDSGTVRNRLSFLNKMAKAKEQGLDITHMEEEWGRRPSDDDGDEEERPRQSRRRSEEDYEEERPRQPRRRSDGDYEEERPRQPRRRSDGDYEEERPRQPRRRSDGEYEEERPRQPRRRWDGDYEEERPRQPRRRSDGDYEEERPRQPRRRQEELTEEEKYLMEERRRRDPNYDRARRAGRNDGRSSTDYRRQRSERIKHNDADLQRSLNDYYNNYMQIREQRGKSNPSKKDG